MTLPTENGKKYFGALLCLEHALIVLFWTTILPLKDVVGREPALCWPHFPWCGTTQAILAPVLSPALAVYAASALIGIFIFLKGVDRRAQIAVLVLLNLAKAFFILQDLRLGGNFHYIPFVVSLIFVVDPSAEGVRWFLVLCYFFAGLLKFNSLWWNGDAVAAIALPPALVAAAAKFAVFLETALIWFLLSRRRGIVAAVVALLVLFHVLSIPSVHWFYPTIMILLLSFFFFFPDRAGKPGPAAIAVLAVFAILQLPPHFNPGDSSVTGEGRLWALNMYDGMTECDALTEIALDDGESRFLLDAGLITHPRIHCDPLTYLQRARAFCREPHARDVGFALVSRSLHDPLFRPRAALTNLCTAPTTYDPIFHNAWISADGKTRSIFAGGRDDDAVPAPSRRAASAGGGGENFDVRDAGFAKPDGSRLVVEEKRISLIDATGPVWRRTFDDDDVRFFARVLVASSSFVVASQNGWILNFGSEKGEWRWALRAAPGLSFAPISDGEFLYLAAAAASMNDPRPLSRIEKIRLADGELVARSNPLNGFPVAPLIFKDSETILFGSAEETAALRTRDLGR